jgi:hypothetical protein
MKTQRFAFLAAVSLALGGCSAAPGAADDAPVAEAQEALSGKYFYDVAEYLMPSCTTPVDLVFQDPNDTRRFVPTGARHNLSSFITVKDPSGKDFEEYTVGPVGVRLWSDTSWAYENKAYNPPYCDEVCGAQNVPVSACYREWQGTPADYAYAAPRDGTNVNNGAPFLPRYIPRDNALHTYSTTAYIFAAKRATCDGCNGLTSWHSSADQPATIKYAVVHMDEYRGWKDVLMKAVTDGPGTGDRFWYARGAGNIGFQQVEKGSDPTSLSSPLSYDKVATGKNPYSTGTAFPGANRSCFGLSQGSACWYQSTGTAPIGSWISIRAVNNKYVTAPSFGSSALIANRDAVGDWEKFFVIDLGNGEVALRANANQRLVCADSAGASALIANRGAVGQWEAYQWIDMGNGNFALQSAANGKFVTAESGGAQPLIANRDAVGAWETFHYDVR